jgi:uncharacterized protein YbjT (DUF2867 family)
MRIAVIAADGRSGQAFVKAALDAGHSVRAGVRGKNPFFAHPGLSVLKCDATNEHQVKELLRASDAVVSLIGHVKGSQADVQTRAIKTIIAAMKQRGLTRIISLTGTGVRIKGDRPNLLDKLANAIILKIDPDRIHDGIAHVKVLSESGLDYTVLRVLKLGNGKPGKFSLNGHGPAKPLTSRAEVASAILDCLEDNRFIRQHPVVVPKIKPKS